MLQNKTEGSRVGRPLTGRVRDGDGETVLFGNAALMSFDTGGEKRDAQSLYSHGFQKFYP